MSLHGDTMGHGFKPLVSKIRCWNPNKGGYTKKNYNYIVHITALNCSEENLQKLERLRDDCYQKELQFVFDTRNNKSDCIYLTYWLHHQKVTAGCKTYGEAFYRIRGTVTTISGKYLEPAA